MELTKEEVDHLAELSRLELTEDERTQFAGELTEILSYVAQLQSVDVKGVEPVKQISGLTGVVREDKESYTFPREQMLASAPKTGDDMVEVPQVIKK